jgi:hypothetical protein
VKSTIVMAFMKRIIRKTSTFMMMFLTGVVASFAQIKASDLTGAWETGTDIKTTRIYTDQFFAVTTYNIKDKQFISTAGGRWKLNGKEIVETIEFNSAKPNAVGTEISVLATLEDNKLSLTTDGNKEELHRVDNGTPGKLSGAWLITGRTNDGKMGKMTPGARRTMKILSGTRFQWIAYNVETKEFSGTGGGTYTTENGKYTENILFFSRDNNRVGASLQFDFALEEGNWRHKGLSSKGDQIDEVWTKREKIGL